MTVLVKVAPHSLRVCIIAYSCGFIDYLPPPLASQSVKQRNAIMSRGEPEPSDDAEALNAAWIIFLLTLIIGSAVYRCFGPDSTTQSTCNSVRFDDENECIETDQVLVNKF